MSASRAAGPALGEFVRNSLRGDVLTSGVFCRKRRERPFDLAPHTADSDTEYSLAAANEIDDLIGAPALINARTVTH